MDKIEYRSRYAIFFFTGIIIGLLFGAISIFTLVSYRVDLYHQKIKKLGYEIQEKDFRLEKLEETVNKKKLLVKDVQVELIFNGEQFDKIVLEQGLKRKLAKFIGKEVKTIDDDIIGEMIDQHIIQIDDKMYKVRLTKLLIAELLKIWVVVDLIK